MTVTWKSFLLRPRPSRRTRDEFVAYTQSWERPGSMEPQLGFRPWSSTDDPPSHSLPALAAARVVAGFGDDAISRAFRWGLFRAYFVDHRTISRPEVQADVADAAGLDRGAFLDRLGAEREDAVEQVIAEHDEANEQGITAVPTVVIGDAIAVPGVQEVETYLRLIDRVAELRAAS